MRYNLAIYKMCYHILTAVTTWHSSYMTTLDNQTMHVNLKESNGHLFCKYAIGFINASKSKYAHITR